MSFEVLKNKKFKSVSTPTIFSNDSGLSITTRAALLEVEIGGVETTRDFFLGLLETPSFLNGTATTGMLDAIGTADILAAAPKARA